MSRSKRFIAGLLSGYGNIAANIVFTMASIPLALHYLDKEHFGLWALAAQINGYLNLIDLGMTGAVSRFVADHKDEVNGGEYGSHLLTGGLVFAIQGAIIAGFGIGFSWFAPQWFAIPPELAADFKGLLMLLAGMTGFSVAARSLGSPLWAFQRTDVINYLSTLSILANLALLWFGFSRGWGVFSFAIAAVPFTFGTPAVYAWVCSRNGYYPSAGHWGKISLSVFKRTFHFGKDVLLINLGSQLINASQIMIISRWVSLEAAAVFAVSTKIYTLGMQLIANPISVAGPGLTELHVRGEQPRFVQRYWDIIALTLAASTFVATGLAAGNRSFVAIWTHGSIHWSWTGDLILALLVVLRNLNGCFLNIFGWTKNWRPVRHIYLVEGIIFIPLAIFLAKPYGVTGVLFASLAAHVVGPTPHLARAASRIVGSPLRIAKSLMTSLALVFIAAALGWAGVSLLINPYAMLAASTGICLLALTVAWRMILPENFRSEARLRMANAASKWIKPLIRPS